MCVRFRMPDGSVDVICHRGHHKKKPPLYRCGCLGEFLCDYSVGEGEETCDEPLCCLHAAEIAKESVKTGKTVRELCREKKILPEDELARALDPVAMTEPDGAGAAGG